MESNHQSTFSNKTASEVEDLPTLELAESNFKLSKLNLEANRIELISIITNIRTLKLKYKLMLELDPVHQLERQRELQRETDHQRDLQRERERDFIHKSELQRKLVHQREREHMLLCEIQHESQLIRLRELKLERDLYKNATLVQADGNTGCFKIFKSKKTLV